MKSQKENAITFLKEDHQKVKKLFKQFEETESDTKKQDIVNQTIEELEIHAELEEEIFYPAVRQYLQEEDEGEDLMDEADEEHHVVKLLIAELKKMQAGDSHFDAKYTVLAENVKHHIEEEEGEMFPQVREHDEIDLEELGVQLQEKKDTLKQNKKSKSSSYSKVEESRMDGEGASNYAQSKKKVA